MYKDIYEMILECEAQRKDNEKIVYAIGAGRLFPKVGFIKNQKKAFKEISNRKGFIGVHPIDLWHTLLLFDTLNHAKSAKNYLSEKGIQLGEIAPVLVRREVMLMYEVMLVLDDGEIRVIKNVKLVTWTRARVIFTDVDERSYHYVGGRIQKCEMEYIGRCLNNEETE